MRKQYVLLLALAAVALGSRPALAANTATATVTATSAPAISITNMGVLSFGWFAKATGISGQVQVTPASVRSVSGGAVLGSGVGIAATFSIAGQPSSTYSITLPSSTTITNAGTLTVDNFTSTPSGTGTLDVGGSQTLRVGATLEIPSADPALGFFTGTFNVTVAYN
jgi:hypothetical protein